MILEFATNSSNVKHLAYDRATKTLQATFKGDRVYQYSDVPETTAIELFEANSLGESVGKLFNELVIGQEYSFSEVKK
jgi:hypothetical protein